MSEPETPTTVETPASVEAPAEAPAQVEPPVLTSVPVAAQEDPDEEGDDDEDGDEPDDEEELHGEIYAELSELQDEVDQRQKGYGGVALDPGDDKELFKKAAERFLTKFTKAGPGTAVRDELRDNVYAHLGKLIGLTADLALDSEDTDKELDLVKTALELHKTEIDRIHVVLTEVTLQQLIALTRVLATRVLQRYGADEEVALIARAILDVYAKVPAVAATNEAAMAAAATEVQGGGGAA